MKSIGKYALFLSGMFVNRERFSVYFKQTIEECIKIGINSLFLISIVAVFLGAVSAVQTAYNLVHPAIEEYIIATIVRDLALLELAPTFVCIVLAGKVGSNIASELGTMKITEQIDALEVMGINSSSYLVLPKIVAALITIPALVLISDGLIIYGGYIASVGTDIMTPNQYIHGIRYDFIPFNIQFGLIKGFVFAFLISSISSFQGYYTTGGALEVGQSSTKAVTKCCIAIFLADYLLAELFLEA